MIKLKFARGIRLVATFSVFFYFFSIYCLSARSSCLPFGYESIYLPSDDCFTELARFSRAIEPGEDIWLPTLFFPLGTIDRNLFRCSDTANELMIDSLGTFPYIIRANEGVETGGFVENSDMISAVDSIPPVVFCSDGSPHIFWSGPYECAGTLQIPAPVIEGTCSNCEVVVAIIDTIVAGPTFCSTSPPIEGEIVVKDNLTIDTVLYSFPVGTYAFRYTVTDDYGNASILYCPFEMRDSIPPSASCNDQLSSIGIGDTGTTRIYAADLDEGSNDNCSFVSLQIGRDDDPWSASGYLDFSCEDIGDSLTLKLRVGDDANRDGILGGVDDRFRICTVETVIKDLIPPVCIPPADVVMSCDEFNALGVDWDNTEQVNDIFGTATASDNCFATAKQHLLISNAIDDNCDWEVAITRVFVATDSSGLTSLNTCRQKIIFYDDMKVEVNGDSIFCNNPAESGADVSIHFNVLSHCILELDSIHATYDLNRDGVSDGTIDIPWLDHNAYSYQGDITGHFPEGSHLFNLEIENNCGESEVVEIPFEVMNCPFAVSISGQIKTEEGEVVENCQVTIPEGTGTNTLTSATGEYWLFLADESIENYTITPHLDSSPNLAVSTLDIEIIAQHILGATLLDTPYKRIAADVNHSNSITAQDIIALRKFILGDSSQFPDNNFWRFVPADYIFDGVDPFLSPFPESEVLSAPGNYSGQDFIGIVIGDVNHSAVLNVASEQEDRYQDTFIITTPDQQVEAGLTYKVDFFADNLSAMKGYQFTLTFDKDALNFSSIEYGISQAENFGWKYLNQGIITTSWNPIGEINGRNPLFSLVFHAQKSGHLSDLIQINDRITRAEAYQDKHIQRVALNFHQISAAFKLLPNTPNPFSETTNIQYLLEKATEVTISIRDISGKTIGVYRQKGKKGLNSMKLYARDIPATGLLFYTVSTALNRGTGKMMIE